jgi:hypothetical protein
LSGNYYNHQFVPAVPFAIAILVTWLGSDDKPSSEMVSFGTAVAILGLATATVSHEQPDLDAQLADLKARKTSAVAAAAQIDRALECTGENSYVFIGTNGVQPYGWTTHSPAGPLFFQYNAWFAPSQGHHREVLLDELKQSRLLVFHELTAGDFNDTLEKAIDARFHPGLPPRCASITLDAPWSFRWAEN